MAKMSTNYFEDRAAEEERRNSTREALFSNFDPKFRNACTAVRGSDLLPKTLAELKKVSPVLRYLVEDLGGWPMAAVQLGDSVRAYETALLALEHGAQLVLLYWQ